MAWPKFILITPARNEANYIGQTIKSIIAQSVLPSEWVIVDDGSTDRTAEIAENAARQSSWIKVLRRPIRGQRDSGAGVVEAICDGLQQVCTPDYEFIFNIDADIYLGPHYFRTILRKFKENPQLGVATGEIYDFSEGRLIRSKSLSLGMIGALKSWRRECLEQLDDLPRGEGWEGIDSIKAMQLGWQARTFLDEELRALHLKRRYRRWPRHGQALYYAGAHPLWVLARSFYTMTASRPVGLAGLSLLLGYLQAWFKGAERYEDLEFRQYLRQWQLKKLANLLKLTS